MSRAVTGPESTRLDLPREVEQLLATLLAEPRPADLTPDADRLEAAVEAAGNAAPEAVDELRSAIALVRDGQPCAAVSALLAARSVIGMRSA
jgi:hypothetical protein